MTMPRDFNEKQYKFARVYMSYVAQQHGIEFKHICDTTDLKEFHIPELYSCVFECKLDGQLSEKLVQYNLSTLESTTDFELDCVAFAGMIFEPEFKFLKFIQYLACVTCLALKLKFADKLDCLESAMILIGDVLDLYINRGSFQKAGDWINLFQKVTVLHYLPLRDAYVSLIFQRDL